MSCEFEQELFDLKDDPAAQQGECMYNKNDYVFISKNRHSIHSIVVTI